MKTMIPLFYFPTTHLIVDDEQSMIDLLKLELEHDFKLSSAKSAENALKLINTSQIFNIDNFIINDELEDLHYNSQTKKIDFNKLINFLNDETNINIFSTLITDSSMPNMSGLELCKLLINHPIKKILLTGRVDEEKANEAFNWGLISKFVKKSDVDCMMKLKEFVQIVELDYFKEISENIKLIYPNLSILNDISFISLFNDLIQKNKIKKYCIIDENGSFLLLDKYGKKYVLLITTDAELNEFCAFYDNEPEIKKYIKEVQARISIPFFGVGINPTSLPLKNWDKVFFKASLIDSKESKFYWSLCPC